jgi:isopenicillin N synthase-like dioxygenase
MKPTRMFFKWRDRASLSLDRKKFVGCSSKTEITNGEIDQREMLDWATETPEMAVQVQPWEQLRGASIWPSESALPGFRASMEAFETLSNEVAVKILSALDLLSIFDAYQNGELPP